MYFNNIIGQENIKLFLKNTYRSNRIQNSIIFIGNEGYGTLPMAIAYARLVLYGEKNYNKKSKNNLQNSDLHFIFPKKKTNNDFNKSNILYKWFDFLEKKPYGNLSDWFDDINIENKQGQIYLNDIEYIINKSFLKSCNKGYKIIILWMPETMSLSISNKILNLLEEPPEKTLFLFIGKDEYNINPGILSKMQIIKFNKLNDIIIENLLIDKFNVSKNKAEFIAFQANGNWNKTLKLLNFNVFNYESYFIRWMRILFISKNNFNSISYILQWIDEISSWKRNKQKKFLIYCLEIFRYVIIEKYNIYNLKNKNPINSNNFKWKNFVNSLKNIQNIESIINTINLSIHHMKIDNTNSKIILLDSSFKIIECM